MDEDNRITNHHFICIIYKTHTITKDTVIQNPATVLMNFGLLKLIEEVCKESESEAALLLYKHKHKNIKENLLTKFRQKENINCMIVQYNCVEIELAMAMISEDLRHLYPFIP